MKRTISVLLALVMLLSLTACGDAESPNVSNTPVSDDVPEVQSPEHDYDPNDLDNMLSFIVTTGSNAATAIESDAEALIKKLGDSYQTYDKNKVAVTEYYGSMLELANNSYAAFRSCSIDYFKCVAAQGLDDYKTWDGAVSDFYEEWDDAMGEFYDSWDDAYSDIYDTCDDLISDASDELDYDTYSDAWADMYDEYSDAWKEMYDAYSDAWSKTYSDYSDVWAGFYDGETDVDAILASAAAEPDNSDNTDSEQVEDTSAPDSETGSSDYEKIAEKIEKEVESTITTLTAEWEALSSGIDSYAKYMESADAIEAFYIKVNSTSAQLCATMCALSTEYADAILASGKSTDDMYDDMDEIYDLIYDEAGDDIYDGIYDGLLDDMYDALYDDALDDSDGIDYSDWADARSNEYEMWSDTRSDTYEQWSDYRSDVYEFWSDIRGELWGDDIESAKEVIVDFKEDVDKMMGKISTTGSTEPAPSSASISDAGIDPAFKEAMDSYEDFFDEYVEFMLKFKATEDVLPLMDEYGSMMQQYAETMATLQEIDQDELTSEEALYYTEVMLRINQKILKVA